MILLHTQTDRQTHAYWAIDTYALTHVLHIRILDIYVNVHVEYVRYMAYTYHMYHTSDI